MIFDEVIARDDNIDFSFSRRLMIIRRLLLSAMRTIARYGADISAKRCPLRARLPKFINTKS